MCFFSLFQALVSWNKLRFVILPGYTVVDTDRYCYIITQVILAFWLVLAYDLLEDRRTIDVIITKFCCFKVAERFEN